MILAPSGYQEPPEGPDTILINVSALATFAKKANEDAIAKV